MYVVSKRGFYTTPALRAVLGCYYRWKDDFVKKLVILFQPRDGLGEDRVYQIVLDIKVLTLEDYSDDFPLVTESAIALIVTTSGRSGAYEARVDTRARATIRAYEARKNSHAEANCIEKHAKIDDFSSKFTQKLNHAKIDTPHVIASRFTIIF